MDGNWGTRPISGPANKSGIWGGVFGTVINGEFDTSLSTWSWMSERTEYLEFIPMISSRLIEI